MDPLQILLHQIGLRADANETAFFSRELDKVKAATYDVRFPEFQARSLLPVDNSAGAGVDTITYRQYEDVGKAKRVANYADDIPMVDVKGKEFTQKVFEWADGYMYSLHDIEAAIYSGKPLDQMRARSARRAMEQALDDYAAVGDSAVGRTGLLNDANVPTVTLPNTGAWETLSPQEVLENMNYMVSSIQIATKQIFPPNTLLLSIPDFEYVNQTFVGVDNTKTILRSFLENNPYISTVRGWYRLDTAGSGGIRRAVCYQRSEEVAVLNVPLEFQQLAPQPVGLAFKVPCRARFGGVEIHYPKAIAYADIAAS